LFALINIPPGGCETSNALAGAMIVNGIFFAWADASVMTVA
jgi:hypothetical protein